MVATLVELSVEVTVGAITVPVKVGLAKVAYAWFLTKAVVASLVDESAVDAVGAVGVPVKAGEAKVA